MSCAFNAVEARTEDGLFRFLAPCDRNSDTLAGRYVPLPTKVRRSKPAIRSPRRREPVAWLALQGQAPSRFCG